MEAEEDIPQDGSSPIEDVKLKKLFDWVKKHGGKFLCESREDNKTKVRGLYASQDITDPTAPVAEIPNKLIISPYHIAR